ncbi:transposase [Sulfurimicrobium lacus]|uniref:Transposase n=2 Tax=Sulfurimicrobium lacus TaxID=2715678 RepID=A0A6F8VB54_9PROT|nr:transposase [Sulfurimicrobium lacus]
MPWRDVKPMDEKILFIADHLREPGSFSQLCERYGISRKTGYKWVERYQSAGLEGLEERSRRPHAVANKIPYAIRKAIMELRRQGRDPLGPKKIQALLSQRFPDQPTPSKTTIYNVLKREGMLEPKRRRRRVQPSPHRLTPASAPNELWSADFKGQFKMGNGRWCYPLTVMDHASRYLLGCQGLDGTRFVESQAVFKRLFQEYGLPNRMRTDNGVPFASTATGGLSHLSVWWIRLGIVPERIEPGQPQQNGRHERMHRTLKLAVTHPPSANLSAQQGQFDRFRVDYNEQRPHEGLEQHSPQSCYRPSSRAYPQHLPELEYPGYFQRQKVSANGLAYWTGRRIYIGYLLAGEWVGLEEVGDGVWAVYFGPVRLGSFDERQTKGRLNDYLTLKV